MRDSAKSKHTVDISAVFNLVSDGQQTNVARDKDKMIAEAVWHRRMQASSKQPDLRVRLKRKRR